MHQVKAVIGILRQGTGIGVDLIEQGLVPDIAGSARVDQGDVHALVGQHLPVEQTPVVGLATQVDDPNRALVRMDGLDQGHDPATAGASKLRHQRVGIIVILQGVDQVHAGTLPWCPLLFG
jgi:hypothetical protein